MQIENVKNAVTEQVQNMQYMRDTADNAEGLPAIKRADLGCEHSDKEFALRAADLIAGCSADQFETLAAALGNAANEVFDMSGDEAYQAAALNFFSAMNNVRNRKGN